MPLSSRIRDRIAGVILALVFCVALPGGQPPPEWQAAINQISAESMRGHLSFISSDLLEGRDTPSEGLNIAGEYIAAQFRRAGLMPAGDDGYFQTAHMLTVSREWDEISVKLEDGNQTLQVPSGDLGLLASGGLDLAAAPVVKVDPSAVESLKPEQVRGKVVLYQLARRRIRSTLNVLRALKPAAILALDESGVLVANLPHTRLVDPAHRKSSEVPWIVISNPSVWNVFVSLQPGPTQWKLSLHLPKPEEKPVKLRNVIGLLRGSDPSLADTYVLVTAHYDHIGMAASGNGDRIYNGANDDGSGTVSVMEIAAALAKLPKHPRRSIVFMTFFGEEKGELGSQYYVNHPVFPLKQTVADINLEQLGRTDSSEGPEVASASFTGFDYSDIPGIFQKAGEMTGVKVYKDAGGSDAFFSRSDNQSFADRGVPAHTVCVAFEYPDYHGVGDEWRKIDYTNMAKVDRMLALGVLMIADNPQAPVWNGSNPRDKGYFKAWQKLHE